MSHPKIKNLRQLVGIRNALRRQAKKVVFTNGCFDILHRGHIECLRKAKSFGDVLVVGLNSDSSVRKIKGEKRPILPQGDRAEILASLEMVDYVVIFGQETPQKVIASLVPDVLAKGGDYRKDEIVGRDIVESSGGRVRRIRQVPGRSTKGIIAKVTRRFAGA
jgi:D-beta-D-heptose 7-phosphate kinase/D-beta-D-heptose 1-phosphate adenosyltransferase